MIPATNKVIKSSVICDRPGAACAAKSEIHRTPGIGFPLAQEIADNLQSALDQFAASAGELKE
jgi:hypothetical protein